MSVSLVSVNSLKLIETSSSAGILSGDATLSFQLTKPYTRNSTTTPDVEDGAFVVIAMSGGAATIDFTALVHQILSASATLTKSASGKKIREIMFVNPTGNTGNIRVKNGASNDLIPCGSAAFDFTIPPGGSARFEYQDAGTAIGSSDRNLDISGTGAETLQMLVGWG